MLYYIINNTNIAVRSFILISHFYLIFNIYLSEIEMNRAIVALI